MPAHSKAQLGWIFSNLGKKEGQKWASETPDIKSLPQHVPKIKSLSEMLRKK